MLFYLVTALYILVCFAMMLAVYLQQGKGGDIASAFGGASSQAAFGARSGATVPRLARSARRDRRPARRMRARADDDVERGVSGVAEACQGPVSCVSGPAPMVAA